MQKIPSIFIPSIFILSFLLGEGNTGKKHSLLKSSIADRTQFDINRIRCDMENNGVIVEIPEVSDSDSGEVSDTYFSFLKLRF